MNGHVACKPQGEAAVMAYPPRTPDLPARLHALATGLAELVPPGLIETSLGLASLQLCFDPQTTDHQAMARAIEQAWATASVAPPPPGRLLDVPVVYGGEHGPDLAFVAQRAGLSPTQFIARHCARPLPCRCLGFTPGFPYLEGLDPDLACPRLDSPRPDLPPGAVGLGGDQTGLYPLGGPGGWRIIGRTPLLFYHPRRDPPCLVAPGDMIRFRPVADSHFPAPPAARNRWSQDGLAALSVLRSGGLCLVQDAGRFGRSRLGLPQSGALDQQALAVANALVGNATTDAALELTLLGPRFKVVRPLLAAVCGAGPSPRLDGQPLAMWRAHLLLPDQELSFGPPKGGARAVLALSGGVAVEPELGSRAAYPLGRIGAPLAVGEVVRVGPGGWQGQGGALPPELVPAAADGAITLRAVAGPNEEMFPATALAVLAQSEFTLDERADRRGARLRGPAINARRSAADVAKSEPVRPGVVQITPDGQALVLLREQTMGGYPKIATIIGPDLDLLGQALPGARLRFRLIEPAAAVAATRQRLRQTQEMIEALHP